MLKETLETLLAGQDLTPSAMEAAMGRIMDGEVDPAQVAGFLCALRSKGETPAEIAAAARTLRARARVVSPPWEGPLLDTCGTGGDGLETPNVSTMVALVAAAAGLRVAKHGNRSVSSRSGSADLLEALGIPLDPGVEKVRGALEQVGITFLFAPAFHPAMRHAGPVRKALRVRTLFNILGPLANPMAASHQVLGVFDGRLTRPLAETLRLLGVEQALVIHGEDGMDELTTRAPTRGHRLSGGEVTEFVLHPGELGLRAPEARELRGGTAEENAALARELLAGGGPEALRDLLALNAGAALWIGQRARDLPEGVARAREILREGAGLEVLERWRAYLGGEAPKGSPSKSSG